MSIRDENADAALFSELGSSAAAMEAGKVLDAYEHAPGNGCQQADGKQAYTQTTLKGTETWVRLPKDRWPKEWIGKYGDPVVRLHLGPEFRDLKHVSTPFAEDRIARPVEAESGPTGKLVPIASRVLMKLLFAARVARYDLLRAVQGLACRVTKWSMDCDKALHRLKCYVNSTIHYKMSSVIGDDIKSCKLWLFEHDSKSTSGSFFCLVGPSTYFPLSAFSKKQTSVALSSTEAEVVCANIALRSLGLPSSAIWSVLQNAGGMGKDANKPTALGRDAKKFNCSKHRDSSLSKVEYEGTLSGTFGCSRRVTGLRRKKPWRGKSFRAEPINHPLAWMLLC